MKKAQKKTEANQLFKSIRKPIAPPTRKIESDKTEEKNHPAGRKAKYKKPLIPENE